MIDRRDPNIAAGCQSLLKSIRAQGVEGWLREISDPPTLEDLVYLCKFAFFTGIVTKSEIARLLQADRAERKALVRSWYDEYREKGCGAC